MSARTVVTLICDTCGAETPIQCNHPIEARLIAKRDGWDQSSLSDYCPSCHQTAVAWFTKRRKARESK